MCLLFTFQGFGRHPARGEPVQAAVRCRVRGSLQRLHHAKVGNNAVAPIRAFSWLKAPTSAFTLKTLLRHYVKQALTINPK